MDTQRAVVRRMPVGILGGMGPLASAEFLKTIYEACAEGSEQQAPPIVLHSDPSMPDRTDAFLNGGTDLVLARFVEALEALERNGVSKIVICCVTIHYLLPRLPAHLRARVVSLLDVIAEAVRASGRRHLLLCTSGTRQLRLFESHEQWPLFRDLLVMPGEADQAAVHQAIYAVKADGNADRLAAFVQALLRKYEVGSFVAGCTEIHLATKRVAHRPDAPGCVDPLLVIADDVVKGRI